MKFTMKLLGMGLVVLALMFTSCAKDGEDGMDGAMGPAGTNGIDGTDGTDGADGANGADGADGNANVMASEWVVADFADTWSFSRASVTINDPNITQEVLSTYTILGYFSFDDSYTDIYAIPFTEPLLRSFTMEQKMAVGEYTITEFGNLDTVGTIDPIDGFVRYILIAPAALSGKGGNGHSIKGMQENGVDLSNYYEVMDYLGMDY
ncbi:collagen-like protein [Zobellia galactanivorans]|uniref:collagen-like protein n=1 Tax=Zobellia galactanivorans (strain DSM 12802 / CCUG 47099 / CIP 106680 / NCIMB 13871 / Dsij) TaxID=63186 RepID=UPI001C071423|nr:collagen-like protein [Zobellia galactanivorans]MBU3024557.1 collagen-like protein [Zobellia galactanivorans]